jgi:hypothetical protein
MDDLLVFLLASLLFSSLFGCFFLGNRQLTLGGWMGVFGLKFFCMTEKVVRLLQSTDRLVDRCKAWDGMHETTGND